MTLRSVMVQLRVDQIAQLDADAKRTGTSRSKLLRAAVDAALAPAGDADVAALYQRAYPADRFGADDWGDVDRWHETAAADRINRARDAW